MVIKSAFILPHGSMILNPSKEGIPGQIGPLHNAMRLVGDTIAKKKPDLIFLSTPHGIALDNDYGLYKNQSARGTAEWDEEYGEYEVLVPLDQDITEQCYQWLKKHAIPVSKITCFAQTVSIPLRWGEAVPIWFLKNTNTKYLIMSQPTRRYEQAKSMIPELRQMGHLLAEFFQKMQKSITVIISGDLAHTHMQEGPYGYSETAEVFDALIQKWITSEGKNQTLLLEKAAEVLEEAMACGFTGFVLLQGILEKITLKSKLLASGHPTYYGMAVATYSIGGNGL
ncbi:MAG: hypothetical protein ACFFFG_10005 [Candidatus Thorarchaeota archaeon]